MQTSGYSAWRKVWRREYGYLELPANCWTLLVSAVVTHMEELPEDAYSLGAGSFLMMTAEQSKAAFGNSICPKFENPDERHPVIYERQNGRYARNILELRAWKTRCAVELLLLAAGPCCDLRSQNMQDTRLPHSFALRGGCVDCKYTLR